MCPLPPVLIPMAEAAIVVPKGQHTAVLEQQEGVAIACGDLHHLLAREASAAGSTTTMTPGRVAQCRRVGCIALNDHTTVLTKTQERDVIYVEI